MAVLPLRINCSCQTYCGVNFADMLDGHVSLLPQDKIIGELGMEMDSTSNRLDFVQVSLYNESEL